MGLNLTPVKYIPDRVKLQSLFRQDGNYQNHPGHSKILIIPFEKVTKSRNIEGTKTP